jgi:predicted TIM-barrel fold metal-dependent hydrolase
VSSSRSESTGAGTASAVAQPVIDAGLYCNWPDRQVLYSYLSQSWQDYLPPRTRIAGVVSPWTNPEGEHLASSAPAGGGAPGSDPALLLSDAVGANVERAVLLLDEGGSLPAVTATYLVHELVRAANDWLTDTWLSGVDDRLYGLALVPSQQPEEAAREIERVGAHARIAGVHLRGNALGKPFGHPVYHPIYEAATSLGLPVVIEAGGDALTDTLTHPTAGGLPITFGEYASLQGCSLMTHIVSLVSQGVFRKYPDLKVMLSGGGLAWIPWLFWRADTEWKNIRREIPWVDVPPSEYFHERVRFTTSPLALGEDGSFDLAKLLGAVPGAEKLCCFASNYPRWNAETPDAIVDAFPEAWHRSILRDNANDFYRWG